MINNAPLHWFSTKQSSLETRCSFGSEFIAMKQCCEYLKGLGYKLRMMGIPVNKIIVLSMEITNQSCGTYMSQIQY